VPANWSGRRTILTFDGVMTDTDARINGKSVGPVHQGGFYQFKYDVTDLVKPGEENLIEVDVKKKSDNESINRAERQADFWIFGGIFRPVYLESVPQQYIERVAIDAKADGTFAADVITPTGQNADAVDVEILDAGGNVVATGTGRAGRVTAKAPGVKTWTAETPNLYTARFRLKADGNVVHETTKRFGFRTIQVRPGDGVYINGTKVVFKGVNRHAAWPDSGRTLSPKIDAWDIQIIKSMNMNAVRMSHYPPDESFLDLCDEMGLYVEDELCSWQKKLDAPTAIRLAKETVIRDVNHPSIIFWANGNEGGWNTAADGEYDKWDPQKRPVLHPWELHDNIQTKHYPTYQAYQALLNGKDIVMPTEIIHGLYDGGHGAGMRDFWDLSKATPKSAGFWMWVYADEGVVRPDGKMDMVGNGAPDGIVGPWREKEGSYYTIRQIWSPVVLPKTLPSSFDGQLDLMNDYDFLSLDAVKFEWALLKYKGLGDSGAGHDVVSKGTATAPGVAAKRRGKLKLDLPADWNTADALMITGYDANSLDVVQKVYPMDAKRAYAPTVAAKPSADKGLLTSGDVKLEVDPATGAIKSVTKGTQVIPLTAGPRVAAATPLMPRPRRNNNNGGNNNNAERPAPAAPQTKMTRAQWSAGTDGWFCLDYTFQATGLCDFLGVTFDFPPKEVKSARWLGMGPYRVYKNRMEGGNVDVWEKPYNETVTGWTGFVYPEFKGYHADVRWATIDTNAGKITIVPETRGLALHMLTPDIPSVELVRTSTAGYPDGQISLMHAISAIGTKTTIPSDLGPQAAPLQANGSYSGKVWFRFQ
jgi:hypothetical protein